MTLNQDSSPVTVAPAKACVTFTNYYTQAGQTPDSGSSAGSDVRTSDIDSRGENIQIPATGDDSPLALWFLLLTGSVVVMLFLRRRIRF